MYLNEALEDKKLKVIQIDSDLESKKKLFSLGIQIEDYIVKLNGYKWGAILVKNITSDNTMVALGRGLAKKILVEYEN